MRADARAKDEDLVEAAWRLFAEQGPDVPLRTVAAQAGVGIGTLYRHFPTRADLVHGIAAEVRRRIGGICEHWRQMWEDDPEAAWKGFTGDLAALQLGNLAIQAGPASGEMNHLSASSRRMREDNLADVDAVLSRAKRDRLVSVDVTSLQLLVGLGLLTRPVPDSVGASLPIDPGWLVSTFLRGLRPSE